MVYAYIVATAVLLTATIRFAPWLLAQMRRQPRTQPPMNPPTGTGAAASPTPPAAAPAVAGGAKKGGWVSRHPWWTALIGVVLLAIASIIHYTIGWPDQQVWAQLLLALLIVAILFITMRVAKGWVKYIIFALVVGVVAVFLYVSSRNGFVDTLERWHRTLMQPELYLTNPFAGGGEDERVVVNLRCGESKTRAIRPHAQRLVVETRAPDGTPIRVAFAQRDQRIRFTEAIGWRGPLDEELEVRQVGSDPHVLQFSRYVSERLSLLFTEDKPEVPFRVWLGC